MQDRARAYFRAAVFPVLTPLAVDPYRTNRVTGSFVLVDEATNATLAACMVGAPPLAESHIHLVR